MISLRLDPATVALVDRLARAREQSRSDVIRAAIARLAEEEGSRSDSPAELLAPYIGVARGGPPDLSERTGERVKELLKLRRARKR